MSTIVFRTPKVFDVRLEEESEKLTDQFGYAYKKEQLFVVYRPSEKGKEKRVKIEEYVGNEFKRCGKNIFDELNNEGRNFSNQLRLVRTNTRDGIKKIYSQESVESCMVSDWEYAHPCEAYATEDFELIGMYYGKTLVARRLCSVKNKARLGIYTYSSYNSPDCECEISDDGEEHHVVGCINAISNIEAQAISIQLAEIVRLMGYKKSDHPFLDCKLLRIKTPYGYCMPYIDDPCAACVSILDKDFFVVSDKDSYDSYDAASTDGYA